MASDINVNQGREVQLVLGGRTCMLSKRWGPGNTHTTSDAKGDWFAFFGLNEFRACMFLRSATSMTRGRLFRLAAVVTLAAMSNGCASMVLTEKIAVREEPQESKAFFLTADENEYTVSRWWQWHGRDYETVTISRRDLPAGCETARFFLNGPTHELRITEPVRVPWLTGVTPPLPDENYPSCALLVSYGSFSGPPAFEGVAVTSSAGMVAKGERPRPRPAFWALTPALMMAEGFAMVGAFWTAPIWAPVALMSGQDKEKERSVLPPPVTACWTALDDKVKNGWFYDLDIKVTGFGWSSENENAYVLTTANELFSDDNSVSTDSRVTLRKGHLYFQSIGADVEVECGLQSGSVVAIRVSPLL